MRVLAQLLFLTAALGVGAASAHAAAVMGDLRPPPAAAIRVAKTHVVSRFGISGLYSIRGLRSDRNRSWATVNGYYRKPRRQPNLWVTYLRVRDGRWRVTYSGIGRRAIEPRVPGVPCDIWPPFSEANC